MTSALIEGVPAGALGGPTMVACLLPGFGRWLPRWFVDLLATCTAASVAAAMAVLLWRTGGVGVVSWLGGWGPPAPTGIALVADPVAAGLVALAGLLTCCALLFGWRYFESVEAHFHGLMLLFLVGMTGFAFAGDLFTMLVFLELMGAVAYALTGYKVEEPRSVQGAFNFGVANSLGAYLSLLGIGSLYARTGTLGLAQTHEALRSTPADALLITAVTLVCIGFLVKAAVVPFHFWLADAHAVAPAPVCVLFSGVMAELGLYALARMHVVVVGELIPGLRFAEITFGAITACVGALLCFVQRNLKRLLACSTIAHIGLFLVTLGVGGKRAVVALILYVAGHAVIKSMLFLLVGVLLDKHGSVDETGLHGAERDGGATAWLLLFGALALAGLPVTGVALGKSLAEEELSVLVGPGALVLFLGVSVVTGAAVLRAALRVYFGVGRPAGEQHPSVTTGGRHEEPEVHRRLRRPPFPMLLAVVLLG